MDFTALVQTPVNTILVLAGIAIVFFTFFEVNKSSVKQRKTPVKKNLAPIVVGAILILGGLFYKLDANVPLEPTPFPEASATIAPTVQHSTVAPTNTSIPIETESPTETPVIPTLTSTPTTIPTKTVVDGCIDTQTWQATSIDTDTLNKIQSQNNCWNLNSLGFSAETGGTLHIISAPSNVNKSAGIYTNVRDNSVIEFNVYINNFYIVYDAIYNKPGYISFSIAPQDNPMATKGSGRFKLQVNESGSFPLVLFILADTIEPNGTELGTQHYLYGRTYNIRMELQGIFMNIYINNIKVNQTVTIPDESKVFYIGYQNPILGSENVEISDLIIDGIKQ